MSLLAKVLAFMDKTGMHRDEAELYRIKGELTLQRETRGRRLETTSHPKTLFLNARLRGHDTPRRDFPSFPRKRESRFSC
jgi:hypothetical protein